MSYTPSTPNLKGQFWPVVMSYTPSIPNLKGFGPPDWALGLEAGIWALRLRYGPRGWGEGGCGGEEGGGGEEEGENPPYV